jgi:hypothetical protein
MPPSKRETPAAAVRKLFGLVASRTVCRIVDELRETGDHGAVAQEGNCTVHCSSRVPALGPFQPPLEPLYLLAVLPVHSAKLNLIAVSLPPGGVRCPTLQHAGLEHILSTNSCNNKIAPCRKRQTQRPNSDAPKHGMNFFSCNLFHTCHHRPTLERTLA